MPKIPPCEQYEPPRNILYTRNKKKFCRVARKGEGQKGPFIPPCSQYGKEYGEYQRLGKTFCRKIKKKTEKKPKVSKKCLSINEKTLKQYAKKMNINLTKYRDKEWICDNLQSLFNINEPNDEDIKYLSTIFKIKTRNKKISQLKKEIVDKSIINNKELNKILSVIQRHQKIKEEEYHNLVINTLLSVLYPNNFPHNSPIPITQELYTDLIKKKVSNQYLSSDEKELLDTSLYIKFCHCIRKLFFKNKFLKDFLSYQDKDLLDPYANCSNSVYKQRGFQLPPKASFKCRDNFEWCKNTEYVSLQNKKMKYNTKKKGGSNSHYLLNKSGYIGSYPPSQPVTINHNQLSCFNDFQSKPPLHYPNRFSCFKSYHSNTTDNSGATSIGKTPDNCNQWAGGVKDKSYYGGSCNCGMTSQELNLILQNSAKPSGADTHNILKSGEEIGIEMDNQNQSWNNWMKKHDNYYWGN